MPKCVENSVSLGGVTGEHVAKRAPGRGCEFTVESSKQPRDEMQYYRYGSRYHFMPCA